MLTLKFITGKNVQFQDTHVNLWHRHSPEDEPSNDDLTLLFVAEWENDSDGQKWYEAANDVRDLFVHTSALTRNIKMEIVSWMLTEPRNINIVEPNHPIVDAWPTLNRRIHQIIDATPKLDKGWLTIDVLRFGFRSMPEMPYAVTISITVDMSLDRRDWLLAELQIKDVVAQHGFRDVEVEIERGELDPTTAFQLQNPRRPARENENEVIFEDYPQRVGMGCDFGPQLYFTAGTNGPVIGGPTATIGGYIEVSYGKSPYKKFAVTNYHCIREALQGFHYIGSGEKPQKGLVPPTSHLQTIDMDGMFPDRLVSQTQRIECPSGRKHNFTMHYHDEEIAKLQDLKKKRPDISTWDAQISAQKAIKDRKIAFFDQAKHDFGTLWLCSGYNTKASRGGRVDVALIQVEPSRMGNNTIPNQSQWAGTNEPNVSICGTMLQGLADCEDGPALGKVYKVGARTGGTCGRLNSIRSDIQTLWDQRISLGFSREYCLVSDPITDPRPFQDHGDSGPFVWTEAGQWAGISWGGPKKSTLDQQGLGYVMDAGEFCRWLEAQDGGNRYKVRLATS